MKETIGCRRLGLFGAALFCLVQASSVLAQGVYGQWFNTSRGTVPESAIGAALDISTNVYVLGRFYAQTNKVGSTILTNTLATCNLFLFQFKGSSTAAPNWAKVAQTDYPISNARIVADSSGNSYVTGSYGGTNLMFGATSITNFGATGDDTEDVFLAKFSTTGAVTWLEHIGGTGEDTLGDMALDPAGLQGFGNPSGFYVTGCFQSPNFMAGNSNLVRISATGSDCYTAKFDTSGNLLWLSQGSYASGNCIAVDTSNNCYVAGSILGSATFGGLSPANPTTTNFLIKYDAHGNPIWVRGDVPLGNRLAVDSYSQDIYVAGTFSNTLQIGSFILSNNLPSTIFLAKYDSNGNPLWMEQIPGLGWDGVTGMTIDRDTNCWITGYFAAANQTEPQLNSKAIIACFDVAGNMFMFSEAGGAASEASGIVYGPHFINFTVFGSFATNISFINQYVSSNSGNADIFASIVALRPKVKMTTTSTNVIITWSSEDTGFSVQSLTNLGSANWTTIGSGTLVNGLYVVTNTPAGKAQFYRLYHP
jgi:hypothetical protein